MGVTPIVEPPEFEVFAARVNGVRLSGLITGPAGGTPVLLLHAMGETSSDWIDVMSRLAAAGPGFRMLALDLRGHGSSDWPGQYSCTLMRDDVIAVLDQLGWGQVALIGHSLGGFIAYLVAEAQPSRVSILVAEDVPAPRPRPPRVLEKPDAELPFDWDMVVAINDELVDPDPACWDQLTEITAATLIIAGGEGSHIPQDQVAATAARIPGARLVTIPSSHYVHGPEPERFTAEVLSLFGPH